MRLGLSREDLFIVGCDVVMTDSMAYADVVLPACSHFEFDDIYTAYGQNYLQRAAPAIPPAGESLPNTEIFRRLSARFGFDDPIFTETDAQLIDAAVEPDDPRLNRCLPSQLPLNRAIVMNTLDQQTALMCNTVQPATASGKVKLYSQAMEQKFGYGVPRYQAVESHFPLMLISPSSSKRTNATFGNNPASQMTEIIEIHPDDAVARGIEDNQAVRLWNELGEVELIAHVNDSVAPAWFIVPKEPG